MDFYFTETHTSDEKHIADLKKVSKVVGLLTFYVLGVPTVIYAIFTFFGSGTPGYQRILAVYGYSFTIFIPACILLVSPIDWLEYLVLILAAVTSLFFISKELIDAGHKYLEDKVIKIIAIM